MIGRTISHYKILEKLGEGGMGVVYKAEDAKLKRNVAIKFLSSNLLESERDKSRFIHEAQAAAGLDHTNICTVHEINEADGHTFIVMAYIEGESLKDHLETDAQLDIEQAVDIATQVARGLTRAHNKGIVHRDIKPANIRITPEKEVKIVDFGLARAAAQTTLTQEGMTVGTVAYMSPEQAQGNRVDHRSDIFSLGVVLYEMLAGYLPFRGDRNAAIVYGIVNSEPEPLTGARDDLPDGLIQIEPKAITKDVNERYQSAADMADDLERLVKGDAPRLRTRRKRRRRIAIAVVGAVVVAAVVAVVKFTGKDGADVEAAENKLAIMNFENLVDADDPQRWGRILQEYLINRLSDIQSLNVMSSQRLYDLLNRLGKADLQIIDGATATEVALAAGANWVLSGSILQSEPNFVLTSQVVNVKSGDVAESQQITGIPGEQIFTLAERLTREIISDLDIPTGPEGPQIGSSAEMTAQSEEAYRHYVDGLDYLNRDFPNEALRSFERALDYDSTFAMAYLRLSRLDYVGPMKKMKYLRKAIQYSDKASEKDQLYIASTSAQFARKSAEAIEGYETIVEKYPEEKEAYLQLGILYLSQGNREKAFENSQKVIDLDPLEEKAYVVLHFCYAVRDYEKALWAVDKYIELAPDNADGYSTKAWFYAYNGRIDDAIAWFTEALKRNPNYPESLHALAQMNIHKGNYEVAESYARTMIENGVGIIPDLGQSFLAFIPLYQGKLAEGIEVLDVFISADRIKGNEGYLYGNRLFERSLAHLARKDTTNAVADADLFIEFCKKNDRVTDLRVNGVQLYAQVGEYSKADEILKPYEGEFVSSGKSTPSWYRLPKGVLELERGNLEAAREHLQIASDNSFGLGSWTPHYFLARVLLEMNQWEDAIEAFEEALSIYEPSRIMFEIESVKTHYYLGRAYEQSGQEAKAAEQYETFLAIWRNADPGIDELEDAKLRLAALHFSD